MVGQESGQRARAGDKTQADRLLADQTVFIPIADPVRWSLVSARLTGFAPNPFAHHNLGELIAERQ